LPVEFTSAAKRDLYAIFDLIVARSSAPLTATRYVERIEARCRAIGNAPHAAPPRLGLKRGIRLLPFERSAMVAYVIENETVVIARIFYRGRNYLKLLQ
jgi:toxin ParE1/3/4